MTAAELCSNKPIADSGRDTSNFTGGPKSPTTSARDSRACHRRCWAAMSTPTAGSVPPDTASNAVSRASASMSVWSASAASSTSSSHAPLTGAGRPRCSAANAVARPSMSSSAAMVSMRRKIRPAATRASRSAKPHTAVTRRVGRGCRRISTAVITPRVPSAPTNNAAKSYPAASERTAEFRRSTDPSGRATSRPRTCLPIVP